MEQSNTCAIAGFARPSPPRCTGVEAGLVFEDVTVHNEFSSARRTFQKPVRRSQPVRGRAAGAETVSFAQAIPPRSAGRALAPPPTPTPTPAPAPARGIAQRGTSKRRTAERRTAERRTAKRRTAKRGTAKRRTANRNDTREYGRKLIRDNLRSFAARLHSVVSDPPCVIVFCLLSFVFVFAFIFVFAFSSRLCVVAS